MLEYYIWLHELKGIPLKDKKVLLEHFGEPENLFKASKLDFPKEYSGIAGMIEELKKEGLEKSKYILQENKKYGINLISIGEELYPYQAGQHFNSPLILYYRGTILKEAAGVVSIVGTRKPTEYGIRAASIICSEYVEKGCIIISGMAVGIDTTAHRFAMEHGGITYGFSANGLDSCYPKENSSLMEEIIYNGAVLSQYPVGTPPMRHRFIKRNEIMSCWADEVVVVEGGIGSGAVVTGRFGLMNNKEVFSVPNSIFSDTSAGCNALILEGAKPYILRSSSKSKVRKKQKEALADMKLNKTAKSILELLMTVSLSAEDVCEKLNLGTDYINAEIMELELKDQIRYKHDGKWHYIGW